MSIDPSLIPDTPRENEAVHATHECAEALALLALRRSTKIAALEEPGPSKEQCEALIRLAARVPDHGKLAPWRFVVFAGEGRVRAGAALSAVVAAEDPNNSVRIEAAHTHFLRAPACVMVVSSAAPNAKIPEWEQVLSAGAATYGLLLAAHAMGFAGAWLSEWPCYAEKARAALGLDTHERIAGFVYLGSTTAPALERPRAAPRIDWL